MPDWKFPRQESEFTLSGRCDGSDVEGPAQPASRKHDNRVSLVFIL